MNNIGIVIRARPLGVAVPRRRSVMEKVAQPRVLLPAGCRIAASQEKPTIRRYRGARWLFGRLAACLKSRSPADPDGSSIGLEASSPRWIALLQPARTRVA